MERELVKIKSDNPAFNGYYTQFKDNMKPGDVEYFEGKTVKTKGEPGPGIQIDPGDPPAEPINPKPAPKPAKNRKVKK